MSGHEHLTFDRVAADGHEASFDEVAQYYAGPMSKHPVINVKGHPEVVWVRPDMGIGTVACPVAFGVGNPPRQIPWREVKRARRRGYLPIIVSTWQHPPFVCVQTAFATLLDSRTVRTGHEKQVVMVEMSVRNSGHDDAAGLTIWAFVPCSVSAKGIPPFPYNTYDLFEIVGGLPAVTGDVVALEHDLLQHGSATIGLYRADASVQVRGQTSVLRFDFNLRAGEDRAVHLLFTSSALGLGEDDVSVLRRLEFSSAHDLRMFNLETILQGSTQIEVPEPVVNDIYKAQILDIQAQLLQAADRDYCVPVQGYQGVWPWEAMKLVCHLDSIGYHEDARRCLAYFLRVQDRFPPHGQHTSNAGVFGGTICFEESGWDNDADSTLFGQLAKLNRGKEAEFPNWMNGTGAILYAFGTHYQYTKDREWLEEASAALLRACDWILRERRATKQLGPDGQKVLHYGLLPIGRAYDTADEAIQKLASDGELPAGKMDDRHAPLDTYYPCWTDSYSSQGLSAAAEALADIGHPEGGRLLEEATAYRDDLLEVMRRTRTTDAMQPPYPERLYRPPAWAEFATGALAYADTGFLDPRSAEFAQLEAYMKARWNRGLLGLTGGMEKNGDPHGTSSYYVDFSEDIWHRGWLLRGELEKALLAFYSMLAYGTDKQTHVTVERFHLADPRYAPFFMDTSASARVCGLIRQALLLEAGDTIYLLAGAPRAWLQNGKTIRLAHGITTSAKLTVNLGSEVERGKILADIVFSGVIAGRKLQLRVPHPDRRKIRQVILNGETWTRFDAEREVVHAYVQNGRMQFSFLY